MSETNLEISAECVHPGMKQPEFDEQAAKDLSTEEIRKRWPRGFHQCVYCGSTVIQYASFAHFIYGDW